MRRVFTIILFAIAIFTAQSFMSAKPAEARWTGTIFGGVPGCTGSLFSWSCDTAMENCQSIANHRDSANPTILYLNPRYAAGRITSYDCGVVFGFTGTSENWVISPACAAPSVNDGGVPSGCSPLPPPPPKQLGCDCGNGQSNTGSNIQVGNPISVNTGNKFEQVTDYESAGPQKLSFRRYYNSQSRTFSSVGMRWRSNFDRRIIFDTSTSVYVARYDGAELHFNKVSSVWVSADNDVDATLTTDGSTVWTFTGHDDTVETYDFVSGRLLSIVGRDGYQQNLAYDTNGLLATVTDSYSRTLTFTFFKGVLQTLTDPDGRGYTYAYDTQLLQNPDRLLSVTYPGTAPNPTVQYVYENTIDAFLLTASSTRMAIASPLGAMTRIYARRRASMPAVPITRLSATASMLRESARSR